MFIGWRYLVVRHVAYGRVASGGERWLCHLDETTKSSTIFAARCYASAVLAMALCLSVCLSVRLSATSRCSTKTAKRRVTQTTPHDSPATLVY